MRTKEQHMLLHFENAYPQAPITGQRPLQYGAWMLERGRGHVGLRTTKRSKNVEVMDLWVAPNVRREGVGRSIMAEVCLAADIFGVALKLRIRAYHRRDNGCTNGQLATFYKSFGFIRSDREPEYYYRAPRNPL